MSSPPPEQPQAAGPWLTGRQQRAWRAQLEVSRLLSHQLDRDLHRWGLTGHDYEILTHLSEAPGQRIRMAGLAELTCQSRSRLSHQISRMAAAGLVRRDSCADDGRGQYAVLTERGARTVERVAPHHVASVRRHLIDRLSPQQLDALYHAYQPVAEYLRAIRDRR